MKEIQLHGKNGKGKVTLVDDEDYEYLNQYEWKVDIGGYAHRHKYIGYYEYENLPMHREIINPSPGFIVDHKNHDKLDNRRCNLRVCTYFENNANAVKQKDGRNAFKGITWHVKQHKWEVKFYHRGKYYHIGSFDDLGMAVKAYYKKSIEVLGEFSYADEFKEYLKFWYKILGLVLSTYTKRKIKTSDYEIQKSG